MVCLVNKKSDQRCKKGMKAFEAGSQKEKSLLMESVL